MYKKGISRPKMTSHRDIHPSSKRDCPMIKDYRPFDTCTNHQNTPLHQGYTLHHRRDHHERSLLQCIVHSPDTTE